MTTVTQGNTSSITLTGADSVALTLVQGTRAHVSVRSSIGTRKYGAAITESRTIGPFATGDTCDVTAMAGSVDYAVVFGNATTLSGNYTLRAADDQRSFDCTTALTISIPDGLSPRPTITVVPPPTGNLSFSMLGAETLNGATTTLTRARAANIGGVVLAGYKDAAAYGLTGA